MKISDIKGAFAQRLRNTTNCVLKELVKNFIKNEFDYESNFIDVEPLYTIKSLKCLFKDYLTSSYTSSYDDNYVRCSVFYVSRINMSPKWPEIQMGGKYNKVYTGKHKYIDYEIDMHLERHITDHNGNIRCELMYKFSGDLNEALVYCPYEIKKTFVYKDVNDVEIKNLDDVIYTKNGEIRQGTVTDFKENLIILDGGETICVDEYIINKNVIVANCRFNFAGIKV